MRGLKIHFPSVQPGPIPVARVRRYRYRAPTIFNSLLVGLLVVLAFLGPSFVASPNAQNLTEGGQRPIGFAGGTAEHLMGTDLLGRDIFARSVYGLRSTVETALLAVSVAAVLGILIGVLAGFVGSWVDDFFMRLVDMQLAIPNIMLLLLVASLLRPSFWTQVAVLALVAWVVYVRIARAEVLALKEQDMVVALTAMGASPTRLLFRHILPNIAGPLIVITTIEVAHVALAQAGLSYLGLGIPPPQPTLGGMIADGQGGMTAGVWWPIMMPGLLLTVLILSIAGLGENLRDGLDPRSRVRINRSRILPELLAPLEGG